MADFARAGKFWVLFATAGCGNIRPSQRVLGQSFRHVADRRDTIQRRLFPCVDRGDPGGDSLGTQGDRKVHHKEALL